ncbi:hypothetical protein GCM10009867_08110 [Pedococcus aerophilus]|uniref:Protein NO VEIN C-terminal domain-containing protein n=1 Tax=Pedococcus aerophilus TaxID=436356 RepID=A0ABN3UKL7_9MICO
MSEGWSESEVERTLDAYFEMFRLELAGDTYRKVDFYRPLSETIGRSENAVGYKFSNVSAVLAEMGATFVEGYKPLANVQELLRTRAQERLAGDPELRRLMIHLAASEPTDGERALGDPVPVPDDLVLPDRTATRSRRGRSVDFNALEATNSARGLAGELMVLHRERRLLADLGRPDLSKLVRHVSVEDGDGLGYDVRSFDPTGKERFLEVKTTIRSQRQPFYVSANEVDFSEEAQDRFTLVRVFHLERNPGFYEMSGSLKETALLVPDSYVAQPIRKRAS